MSHIKALVYAALALAVLLIALPHLSDRCRGIGR